MRTILTLTLLTSSAVFAADPAAQVYNSQINTIEREVLSLAKAMPADKYNFAPTNGSFQGVRTFGVEVRHLSTVMYMLSASLLGEKCPVDIGKALNGSESINTKDQIVKYFEDALAYAHKAAGTITEKNLLENIKSPYGRGTMIRMAAANEISYHTYDHYGQMVEYARMNGIIPPASQPRPARGRGRSKGR
ncbi:MAG TPA: DinB family protein [Bryobacteraceae bacterium]|nr:DinB family protein [Bryobacteraceae bacterium]